MSKTMTVEIFTIKEKEPFDGQMCYFVDEEDIYEYCKSWGKWVHSEALLRKAIPIEPHHAWHRLLKKADYEKELSK